MGRDAARHAWPRRTASSRPIGGQRRGGAGAASRPRSAASPPGSTTCALAGALRAFADDVDHPTARLRGRRARHRGRGPRPASSGRCSTQLAECARDEAQMRVPGLGRPGPHPHVGPGHLGLRRPCSPLGLVLFDRRYLAPLRQRPAGQVVLLGDRRRLRRLGRGHGSHGPHPAARALRRPPCRGDAVIDRARPRCGRRSRPPARRARARRPRVSGWPTPSPAWTAARRSGRTAPVTFERSRSGAGRRASRSWPPRSPSERARADLRVTEPDAPSATRSRRWPRRWPGSLVPLVLGLS